MDGCLCAVSLSALYLCVYVVSFWICSTFAAIQKSSNNETEENLFCGKSAKLLKFSLQKIVLIHWAPIVLDKLLVDSEIETNYKHNNITKKCSFIVSHENRIAV